MSHSGCFGASGAYLKIPVTPQLVNSANARDSIPNHGSLACEDASPLRRGMCGSICFHGLLLWEYGFPG